MSQSTVQTSSSTRHPLSNTQTAKAYRLWLDAKLRAGDVAVVEALRMNDLPTFTCAVKSQIVGEASDLVHAMFQAALACAPAARGAKRYPLVQAMAEAYTLDCEIAWEREPEPREDDPAEVASMEEGW